MRLDSRIACASKPGADRLDPDACYHFGYTLLERWGPYAAWQFLNEAPIESSPRQLRAHWLGLKGRLAAKFRDFNTAHDCIQQAALISPNDAWLTVEYSSVLEMEDRHAEALAKAQESLTIEPWLHSGVMWAAHLLQRAGRDYEARELLAAASTRLESIHVLLQLAELHHEIGDDASARRVYAEITDRYPMLETPAAKQILARRTHLAYVCGEYSEALALARQLDDPFFDNLRRTLADGNPIGQRVQLPVGFVRQSRMTCSPATLTAISHFWQMPADHLELAEEICYDGTPPVRERQWVEENGWVAREFTVTWESAVALIDRGIPFTLTTVEPTYAHLQAVIGYDSRYRSLLVRDPSARNYNEYMADTFLARYHSTGPRGMAFVPSDKCGLFDGLELPDQVLYDQVYALQRLLLEHRRDDALAIYRKMYSAQHGHRLVLTARRMIAVYDKNESALLKTTNRLLSLYPGDPVQQTSKISSLRQLDRREARLQVLSDLIKRPELDTIFRLQYAEEISVDARQHRKAVHLIRNVLRRNPSMARAYFDLAVIRFIQRKLEEAVELYRIAACLEDKDEQLAWSYFRATRAVRRTDEAIAFLNRRVGQFGAHSGRPSLTLFAAYCDLDRMPEGLQVLEAALAGRPDDIDLKLAVAEALPRAGEIDRAAEILASIKSQSHRGEWRRTAANVARASGELPQSLHEWQEVLNLDPLSMDAHAAVAQLLAETASVAAAIEHLQRAAGRYPSHYGLHRLWAEWARNERSDVRRAILHGLIRIDPSDAWARREMAICLCSEQKPSAAQAEIEIAIQCDPHDSANYVVRGLIEQESGRDAAAKTAYRHALRLSIDNQWAMRQLFALCESPAERRESFQQVRSELVRQVNYGDGLLAFAELAQVACEPELLLSTLREAWEARPDLWHAWSALIHALRTRGEADAALDLARQACDRFPLIAGAWCDLANVHRDRNDFAGQVESLGAPVPSIRSGPWRYGNYRKSTSSTEKSFALASCSTRQLLASRLSQSITKASGCISGDDRWRMRR